jgi:hypothetical protein
LWILRNSVIEKALDDHEKIKLFYKIVGLDELERRSGKKSDGNLHKKMCTVHRFLCMPYWMETMTLVQKLFNRAVYALEWKRMAGLDKLEVQMFGNERRSDKPFAPV